MGLFFSKCVQRDRELRAVESRIQVFRINNVAKYLWETCDREKWPLSAFPNVAPPFRLMWFEYRLPMQSNSGGKLISFEHGGALIGIAVEALDPQWLIHEQRGKIPMDAEAAWQKARWCLRMIGWTQIDGGIGKLAMQAVVPVMPGGEIAEPGVMSQIAKDHPREEETRNIVWSLLYPVLLAISFMHCKNVTATTHQTRPHGARKSGNRGVTFHVLEINPMMTVLRAEYSATGCDIRRSLHICRGHFKDYRDGRGLFGKYRGLYWWEQMVRGSADEGVALKDYAIAAPKEGPA